MNVQGLSVIYLMTPGEDVAEPNSIKRSVARPRIRMNSLHVL